MIKCLGHEWTSENGKWNIFSFTSKFEKIDGVFTVVGNAIYVTTANEYDNPDHPLNLHVPFNEKGIKLIPKYVRQRAEEEYQLQNTYFISDQFTVKHDIKYDSQELFSGDTVQRMNEWKRAPEGHYIARFLLMLTGEDIPLMMDEVNPIVKTPMLKHVV
jgi:hypothetical protein